MELTSQTLEEGEIYSLKFNLLPDHYVHSRALGADLVEPLPTRESFLYSEYHDRGTSVFMERTAALGGPIRTFVVFAHVRSVEISKG
jgi:hypothetical protein